MDLIMGGSMRLRFPPLSLSSSRVQRGRVAMTASGEEKQRTRMEGEARKRKRRGGRRKPKKDLSVNSSSSPPPPMAEIGSRELRGEGKRDERYLKKKQLMQNPSRLSEDSKEGHLGAAKPQALAKPSNFLQKMKARLAGGHFRMINEKLYTCTGSEALKYFSDDPVLFDAYHTGYQEQMSHWPEQPVNIIIKWLKARGPSLVVADFGCGNACLAKSVKNKVFSLDLVSNDPSVIACDMANTPLDSSSVDVAVFCLSLMGTNYPSYLHESYRVLKPSGWLLIAEVKSRFDPNTGGADPDKFIKAVCSMGYTSVSEDFSNKMFILLYFKKKGKKQRSGGNEIEWPELKPCIYKRR